MGQQKQGRKRGVVLTRLGLARLQGARRQAEVREHAGEPYTLEELGDALSVKLAERIQYHFEGVIWRSLRNAPPPSELLKDLVQTLFDQQDLASLHSYDQRLTQLLNYLSSSRCLLILDNVETILQSSSAEGLSEVYLKTKPSTGHCLEGYEGYSELFTKLSESSHNSCLVLTSREKPYEIALRSGDTLPVRTLQLKGLQQPEVQALFQSKGTFRGSEAQWQELIGGYSGNPLALKIVAMTIQDVFGGGISEFLAQGAVVFGEIRDTLSQQFQRLSTLEQAVMYWLAINRNPTTLSQLQDDLLFPISLPKLLETFESLTRRCILERGTEADTQATKFTLQPVVMEYVTYKLIEQVCKEITGLHKSVQTTSLFQSHALIKAQVHEYIRHTQVRLILQPLIDQLLKCLGTTGAIAERLNQILRQLRSLNCSGNPEVPATAIGYALSQRLSALSFQ